MKEENDKNSIKEKEDKKVASKPVKNLVEKYEGLGKKAWKELGGTDNYLNRERNSWNRKSKGKFAL